MRLATVLAAGALLLAACAPQTGVGSPAPSTGAAIEITLAHTAAGDALAGVGGKTLYTLSTDTSDTSTCTGNCADTWPPLLGDGLQVTPGDGVSGSFGTITRPGGEKQVTHDGKPLYYYSGDHAAGDSSGDGVGGVWSIATVGEASASQPASDGASATQQPSATPYRAPGY
jgi:predicted lipoprotein with Yx(FWY)xxD motif